MAKTTYAEQFAEKIIEQLEKGTVPWLQPWTNNDKGVPYNPTTGKPYRGGNRLFLSMFAGEDPRFMTFIQAQKEGYKIKKGAVSIPIEYVSHEKFVDKTDKDGKPVLGPDGKPEKMKVHLERPIYKQARVFAASDIEGLPPLPPREKMYEWDPIEKAEKILANSGAVIKHDQADRAFYRPATDSIHLPGKDQFDKPEKYYGTALHELGHWTGHESRLNRPKGNMFGTPEYAKEELRAEISSWMLGQDLGIGHGAATAEIEAQHAAYIKSWIQALKDDPMEIVRASRDAEKIKEYVLGLERDLEKEKANEVPTITPDLKGKREKVIGQESTPDFVNEKMPDGDFAKDTKNLLKQASQEDVELTFNDVDLGNAEELTIDKLLNWTEETLAVSKVEPGLENLEKACQEYAKEYSFTYPDLSNFKTEFFDKVQIERDKQKPMPEIPLVNDLHDLMQDTLNHSLIKPELRERIENLLAAESPSVGDYIDTFKAAQKSFYTENGPAAGMSEICDKYFDFGQSLFKDAPQHEKSSFEANLLAVVEFQSRDLEKSNAVEFNELLRERHEKGKEQRAQEKAAPEVENTVEAVKDKVEKTVETVKEKIKFVYQNYIAIRDIDTAKKARDVINDAVPHMAESNAELASQATLILDNKPTYHELSEAFSAVNEHVQSQDFKGPEQIVERAKELDPNCKQLATEKTYLHVPFKEKDNAKKLGARWDNAQRQWFCPAGVDLKPLQKFMTPEPKLEKQMTLDPQREFADKLRDFGLDLGGRLPIMDGNIHRVPLIGKDNKEDLDGAYKLYDDGRPAGWAMDYTTGEKTKLVATGIVLSDKEREQQRAAWAQKKLDQEANLQKQYDLTAEKAQSLLKEFEPAPLDHPYLVNKGIDGLENTNLLFDREENRLIVPMQNEKGEVRGFQWIDETGNKRFMKDMEVTGNFAVIGNDAEKNMQKSEIVLCEGYATGASLNMATGKPVAVSFNAGNLEAVGKKLREQFPHAKITIAADNDLNNAVNIGVEKAQKAAKAIGADVKIPTFNDKEKAAGLSDFNDLHKSRGLDAVRKQLGLTQEKSKGVER